MVENDGLAEVRTELAQKRTVLAYERTLSAWLRTGIAALAAGLGIPQLIKYNTIPWLVKGVAVIFVLFGLESLFLGIWGYNKGLKNLSDYSPAPPRWLIMGMVLLLVLMTFLALVILLT